MSGSIYGLRRTGTFIGGLVAISAAAIVLASSALAEAPAQAATKKNTPPAPSKVNPKTGIYGKDERRPLPAQYEQLRKSIAQLETKAGRRTFLCTGFCLGDDIVATASHCLTEPQVRAHLTRTTVAVGQAGDRKTSAIAGSTLEEIQWSMLLGASLIKSESNRSNFSQDWALVRTAQPVCKGRGLRILESRDYPASWRETLERRMFLIGFHHDTGPRTLRFGDACHGNVGTFEIDIARWVDAAVEVSYDDLLPHRCDATQGASGGPIFVSTADGPRVVGIMVGTNRAMRNSNVPRAIVEGGSGNRGVLTRAFEHQLSIDLSAPDETARGSVSAIRAILQTKGYLAAGSANGGYDFDLRQAILDLERTMGRTPTGRPAAWLAELARKPESIPNNRGQPSRGFAGGPKALERIVAGATRAIELSPETASTYLDRAIARAALGQRDLALSDFDEAISRDPKSANARAGRGSLLAESGNLERALNDFSAAIQLDPKLAWVANDRGVVLRRLGRIDEAIADFTRALELNPQHAIAYGNRASANRLQGRFPQAIDDYTKAIEFNPRSAAAFGGRAATLADLGQLDRAVSDFDEAIKLAPELVWLRNDRGLILRRQGKTDLAIADFTKAVELDPRFVIGYTNRALAHMDKRGIDLALADYATAVTLEPQRASTFRARAVAWQEKGDNARAIDDLNEAIRLEPANAMSYNMRGYILRRQRQPEPALADFAKAIELDPRFSIAYQNRAGIWFDKGDYDRAIIDIDEAIRLGAPPASAHHDRGIIFRRKGQLDRAVADFETTLRYEPRHVAALASIASVHAEKREFSKAIAGYTRAIEVDPKAIGALLGRSSTYSEMRNFPAAIADMSSVLALEPRNAAALHSRAMLHFLAGGLEQALPDLDRALELTQSNAAIYNSRGWVRFKLGLFQDALSDADKAVRLDPRNAHAADTRAYVLLATGDLGGALAEFDRALALGLNSPVPYAGRGQVHERRGARDLALLDYRKAVEFAERDDRDAKTAQDLARARITALESEPGPRPDAPAKSSVDPPKQP